MASEMSTTVGWRVTKGNLIAVKGPLVFSSDMAGNYISDQVQNIGTSFEAIAITAEIATAGQAWFRNLDATNYVELGIVVSGTFYPLIKLLPGEAYLFRLAVLTVYGKANIAPVDVNCCVAAA